MNCSKVSSYLLMLLLITQAAFTPAFHPTTQRPPSLNTRRRALTNRLTPKSPLVLHQSDDIYDEDDYGDAKEFFVSPKQISFLRKEAAQRQADNRLPRFYLSPDEAVDVAEETLNEISYIFDTSELIEIRGVSRDRKKQVYHTASEIAATLEEVIGKPVVVVEIKGFAVKMYCPWDDDCTDPSRIVLRSRYKPNQWTKKAKPFRNERGQIVKDENGESVYEIPE